MSWVHSIGCSLVCAVAGGVAGGLIGNLCTTWYRVPDREMESAFFLLYAVVLGVAVGLAAGIVSARYVPGGQFQSAVGYGLSAVVAVAGVVYFGARLGGDVPPVIDGSRIDLMVEVRSPAGWKLTNQMRSNPGRLRLVSLTEAGRERGSSEGDMHVRSATVEDGRTVIPGEVYVFTSKGRRTVQVRLDGQVAVAFEIALPGNPGKEQMEWSGWQAGGEGFEYRFRVRRFADERREIGERGQARQQGFQSLSSGSSLEQYLPYLNDGDFDVRNRTIQVVGQRVMELIPLLESGDRQKVELALGAAVWVNPLPAGFEQPLLGVLGQIRRDLQRLKETEATDPDEVEAAALQRLFINWFAAWKGCHPGPAVVPGELREVIAEAGKFDRRRLEDAANIAVLGKRYVGEWGVGR